MPFPVENLIKGHSKPVTVSLKNTALDALHEMIRYDYSQVPVVDEQGRPEGLVTSDTILRGLSNFQVTIEHLHVRDVLCKAKTFSPEDDLFELLPSLRDAYAVLIVDNNRVLTGIVTDYDTSEYFRRRAEDIMLAEDIERTLRDFVLAAFPKAQESQDDDNQNDPQLSEAINKISSPAQDQTRFKQAVIEYLKLEHSGYKLNPASVNVAYEKLTQTQQKTKQFNDLTFSEVEALLFSEDRWSTYGKVFTVGKEPTRRRLDDVRQIRNKLAHFKGDVTELERSRLRSCLDWFQRHQNAVLEAFPKSSSSDVPPIKTSNQSALSSPAIKALRDILSEVKPQADDSKYAGLAMHLQTVPFNVKEVELTFPEIEIIISQKLPGFARQHRSWWANDSKSHVQSQQWLDAGWRVSSVNPSDERVKFTRIAGRSRAFIDFFSGLTGELRNHPGFELREGSPTGDSYHIVKSLPEGKTKKCLLIAVFGLHHKFRVELYIDCGDKDKNKAFFDALCLRKDQIEQAFGNPLSWERLNDKKASRVAYYVEGTIEMPSQELEELKEQISHLMVKFYDCLREPIIEIVGSK